MHGSPRRSETLVASINLILVFQEDERKRRIEAEKALQEKLQSLEEKEKKLVRSAGYRNPFLSRL